MEQVFVLNDFSGGLHYGVSNNIVKDSEGYEFQNVISMPGNYLRSRLGLRKKNASTPSKGAWISGIDQYVTSSGEIQLICVTTCDPDNGVNSAGIYKYDDTTRDFIDLTGTTITWDPDPEDLPFFEQFQGYLVIVNGKNNPVVYQEDWSEVQQFGVNFSITGVSCIPKYVCAFKQFLFFAHTTEGGTTYRSRVRWCEPADITSWPSENYLDLDADDGTEITGIELLGDYIVVFKERKIFVLTYRSGSMVFEPTLVIDGRGCIAPASLTSIYNDLIFFSDDGIYSFDGGGNLEEISSKIKPLVLQVNPMRKRYVQSAPNEELDQLWFAVSFLDSPVNDKVFVYNFTNPDEECWSVYDMEVATLGFYYRYSSLRWDELDNAIDDYSITYDDYYALEGAPQLLITDYDGNVYDHEGTTDSGSVFVSKWQSKYFDFGAPQLNKRLTRLIFRVKKEENASIVFKLYKDFDEENPSSYTLPLYSSIYDGEIIESRVDLSEQARHFKVEVCSEDGTPWEVHTIMFVYQIKGRTQR